MHRDSKTSSRWWPPKHRCRKETPETDAREFNKIAWLASCSSHGRHGSGYVSCLFAGWLRITDRNLQQLWKRKSLKLFFSGSLTFLDDPWISSVYHCKIWIQTNMVSALWDWSLKSQMSILRFRADHQLSNWSSSRLGAVTQYPTKTRQSMGCV